MRTESTDEARKGRNNATDIGDEGLDVPAAMIVVMLVGAGAIVEVADEDVTFGEEVI